ncbi:MAG: Spo0B domain-containing protein [Clostridiales bacterium]|nr:Spo0B domain-containing protein [Clostridiales bacterium]MDY2835372.1 Spo0B domain-containing protein [Candidatus Aphodomonas sp.]
MRRTIDIKKAARYAIILNAVQIAAAVAIALLVLLTDVEARASWRYIAALVCVSALLVICGAIVDIGNALSADRIKQQSEMLEEAYAQLESLNGALRAQRHDFRNHLQVIGGLLEMGESDEAAKYIDRVYGSVGALSAQLRTASPAVNALLRVKTAEAQKRGVAMDVIVRSAWEGLPAQGWEMCRVLGNLIDNAMDALKDTPSPRVTVALGEELRALIFSVENNGPEIPMEIREKIFQPGFTTKGGERGQGLAIVREIIAGYGGELTLESDENHTAFCGRLPRGAAQPPEKERGESK